MLIYIKYKYLSSYFITTIISSTYAQNTTMKYFRVYIYCISILCVFAIIASFFVHIQIHNTTLHCNTSKTTTIQNKEKSQNDNNIWEYQRINYPNQKLYLEFVDSAPSAELFHNSPNKQQSWAKDIEATEDQPKPQSPESLHLQIQDNQINIFWDPVRAIQGYNVYKSINNGGFVLKSQQTETTFIDRIDPDNIVMYVVSSFVGDQESELSSPVTYKPSYEEEDFLSDTTFLKSFITISIVAIFFGLSSIIISLLVKLLL